MDLEEAKKAMDTLRLLKPLSEKEKRFDALSSDLVETVSLSGFVRELGFIDPSPDDKFHIGHCEDNTFKGNCPFCVVKDDCVIMVADKHNIFHCSDCKESGNIFSFLMKLGNIDFKQAVYLISIYKNKGFKRYLSAYSLLKRDPRFIFEGSIGRYVMDFIEIEDLLTFEKLKFSEIIFTQDKGRPRLSFNFKMDNIFFFHQIDNDEFKSKVKALTKDIGIGDFEIDVTVSNK